MIPHISTNINDLTKYVVFLNLLLYCLLNVLLISVHSDFPRSTNSVPACVDLYRFAYISV